MGASKVVAVRSFTPQDPNSSARVGLITRPAFLASGDYQNHPILKGVRLRSALLCQDLPDPPADALSQAEAAVLPDGPTSQRLQAEVRTSCRVVDRYEHRSLG